MNIFYSQINRLCSLLILDRNICMRVYVDISLAETMVKMILKVEQLFFIVYF